MAAGSSGVLVTMMLALLASCSSAHYAAAPELSYDFYDQTCPQYKSVIQNAISDALQANPLHAAGLSRIHFHDCFVQGCDASLLLNVPGGSEQNSLPNRSLRQESLQLIDQLKSLLEGTCPNTVSCADIISLASAEATRQVNGPSVDVPVGRRDSLWMAANQTVFDGLPSPLQNVSEMIHLFSDLGLDYTDFVALSGAHTLGTARCGAFANRLRPTVDPTMDEDLASSLTELCPEDSNNVRSLDDTPNEFDNDYFRKVLKGQSLLTSDATMASDENTVGTVWQFAKSNSDFEDQFVQSFLKMSQIGVLTGSAGEVRTTCTSTNVRTS